MMGSWPGPGLDLELDFVIISARAGAGVTLSRLSPFSAIYGSLDSFQTSFTRSLPRTMVRQINSNTQDSKYLSVFCIYYENV